MSAIESAARPPRKPLALIVDDDPMVRVLAAQAMVRIGLDAAEAADGEEALASVARQVPDIVLLDVQMPGASGFDVCTALRAQPTLALLPILMMTGLDDTESVSRAYEAGATDFVTKPIRWQLLGYRVRYLLRSAAAFRQLEESRAQLAHSRSLLAHAHRIARLAAWEWDPRRDRVEWSADSERALGLAIELPRSFGEYAALVHPEDRMSLQRRLAHARRRRVAATIEHRIIDGRGDTRLIELRFEPRHVGRQLAGIHGTVRDLTERWHAEQKIHRLAYHDSLTGLPNRQAFIAHVSTAIAEASIGGCRLGLLFIDLDRFKHVNDTLGHAAGDALLKVVAERLSAALRRPDGEARGRDCVARLAGDEFVVLIGDVADPELVFRVGERLLASLGEPVALTGHTMEVSASIGIAIYPDDGSDYDTLLRSADSAMYRAKDSGRGAVASARRPDARTRDVSDADARAPAVPAICPPDGLAR